MAGIEAVVIGASAGAVDALSALLPALPADYPLPVMIVVHMPPDQESMIAPLFAARCAVAVREAQDKEPIRAGTVYFAPPNYHLLVEQDRVLSLSSDESVLFSRPSIDVLFESAADAYGPALAGVVLTGANSDGSNGLHAICNAGGMAFVQSPEHSYARAMPESALARCPMARPMRLDEIRAALTILPNRDRL